MNQAQENTKEKQYRIRFKDGGTIDVDADAVRVPISSDKPSERPFLVFKRGGVEVAKYKLEDVSGWQEIQLK